jgi:hypothetical protein
MFFHEISQFIQGVNITILPMMIIPVNGLCCLVFYNRLAAVNSWVHAMQKELRSLLMKDKETRNGREMELITTLRVAQKKLLERSNLVRAAIVCCFSGIVAFILSAISIMLSIFQPDIVMVTLVLWIVGAVLFAIGLIAGVIEVKSAALSNIMLETDLIESWLEQEDSAT